MQTDLREKLLHQLITTVRGEGEGVQEDTQDSSSDLNHNGERTVHMVRN